MRTASSGRSFVRGKTANVACWSAAAAAELPRADPQSVIQTNLMVARKRTFVRAGCFGRNWPSVACQLSKRRGMKLRGLVFETLRDSAARSGSSPRDGSRRRRIRIMREDVSIFAGVLRRQVMNAVPPPAACHAPCRTPRRPPLEPARSRGARNPGRQSRLGSRPKRSNSALLPLPD